MNTRPKTDPASGDGIQSTFSDGTPAAPSTALEVHKPGVLAAFQDDEWSGVDDGLVGWEHVGYQLPRLVSDMRPSGGWMDEVTGDKSEHLQLIWLTAAPGRAWWPEAFGKGDKAPDCRSSDMVQPDEGSPHPQAATCAQCPHSKWGDDGKQGCKTRINALVFDVDAQHLARVSFGVTAIKRVRTYLSSLKAMVPPRPPVSVVTDVKLEEVESDGMRWLEPVLTVGGHIGRAEAEPLLRLRDDFLAQWRSALREDMAAPDSARRTEEGPFDSPPSHAIGDGAIPTNAYDDNDPF